MHGLYFDGDDYMYVDFTDNTVLGKHFTVEMWIRPTERNVTQKFALFEKVEFFGVDTAFFEFYFHTDGSFRVANNYTDVLIIEDAYDERFVGDSDNDGDGDSDAGGWLFI